MQQMGEDRNRSDAGKNYIPPLGQAKKLSPKFAAAKYWNSLPHWLRSTTKENEFRAGLKKLMLDKYEDDCNKLVCNICNRQ